MRIYQAGPLFSEAEIAWHKSFRDTLVAAGHEVVWPGDLVSEKDVAAWGEEAPRRIYEMDRQAIDTADVVVALLDGAQVDDGTAWEMGYATGRGIPVVGLRTDFRRAGETAQSAVNAMIEGSCAALCRTVGEVLETLKSLPF